MPVKPVASKFNKGAVVNPFNVRVKIKGEKKKRKETLLTFPATRSPEIL